MGSPSEVLEKTQKRATPQAWATGHGARPQGSLPADAAWREQGIRTWLDPDELGNFFFVALSTPCSSYYLDTSTSTWVPYMQFDKYYLYYMYVPAVQYYKRREQ